MKKLLIGATSAVAALLCSTLIAAPSQAQEPIVGEMRILPYTFCPRGWALADNSLLSISSNTTLFSLYGTTYGGDGVQTFALPDMRGRMAVGVGDGPALTPRIQGQRFGNESITLLVSQLPTHTHQLIGTSSAPNSRGLNNATWGDFGGVFDAYNQGGTLDQTARADAMTNAGGNQPHYNIQPALVLRHCVATVGIYPSRN